MGKVGQHESGLELDLEFQDPKLTRPSLKKECRVCLQATGQDLISSCGCSGTTELVHYECLTLWVKSKGSLICELCHQPYKEPFKTALQEELAEPRYASSHVGIHIDGMAPLGAPPSWPGQPSGPARASACCANWGTYGNCAFLLLTLLVIVGALLPLWIALVIAGVNGTI
ncbi:hypothetical protein DUNSADRAFT_17441 [Dunaliella salina]|uniref:RING-CH-type domain-containing protein n=1 Tax=Dunaliella salina TaxID=3046 RepID=A0ABQ7H047_DUNSA|nr:hypothetical protein DUNSADRAFT_17441 [Dunaliella salina]|eukprot:KAF5840224.1 hypothetical protein DUNSADRAFT_17441 [Dunaliella salina]